MEQREALVDGIGSRLRADAAPPERLTWVVAIMAPF